MHHGDVTDTSNLNRLLEKIEPDEIYNLAAQSHVKVSFEVPEYTAQVDAIGTLRFLDAIRETGVRSKLYQASTSELFGKTQAIPQNEKTPFYPRSPYAVAKLYGYWIIINYREAYDIFACNGILFNHESPRRGETFVTRKITRGAARIKHGIDKALPLGNLNAKRDWGYAPEYVDGMWRMMQLSTPEDFVLATGESHSVREFADLAFKELDMELEWVGEGRDEKGIRRKDGKTLIFIDQRFERPTEVDMLIGDASKAREKLGWEPHIRFEELVKEMVRADEEKVRRRGY